MEKSLALMPRLLALDYGEKRIGVAITDALYCAAHSRPFIPNTKRAEVLKVIHTYIHTYDLRKIILGLPLNHFDQDTEQTKRVRSFQEFLIKNIDIPVIFHDESFTTQQAETLMRDSSISRKKKKLKKDSLAAQIILQSYMDQNTSIEEKRQFKKENKGS